MHQYPSYDKEGDRYVSVGMGMRIVWQEGPFVEVGVNGSMLEQPVRALLHRLDFLNASLPCPQNDQIRVHLNAILGLLDDRTRDRNSRGVLGTRSM